ncbi:nickel-type superoxide dismutase maturation protease [Shewanella sp. KX20019]|uniref:nickel-type superoxide dismutase maturation protease n=1 Tax=Shewanella sp. KX20019 TaxID=2803864 RepID=UPI0019277B55|nr:nickel-type superoxide dismutase maturation protease [Shewanella sp. KX20019]QQX81423.1 nickel-type superoxide dismutase maturation protease [Shewanella sp. KX20019]
MFGLNVNKVSGDSMFPRLKSGNFVLLSSHFNLQRLKAGDIIKLFHPRYGYIVKTLVGVDHSGRFWFKGENKYSVGIDDIGPVNASQIKSKVIFVLG